MLRQVRDRLLLLLRLADGVLQAGLKDSQMQKKPQKIKELILPAAEEIYEVFLSTEPKERGGWVGLHTG